MIALHMYITYRYVILSMTLQLIKQQIDNTFNHKHKRGNEIAKPPEPFRTNVNE